MMPLAFGLSHHKPWPQTFELDLELGQYPLFGRNRPNEA